MNGSIDCLTCKYVTSYPLVKGLHIHQIVQSEILYTANSLQISTQSNQCRVCLMIWQTVVQTLKENITPHYCRYYSHFEGLLIFAVLNNEVSKHGVTILPISEMEFQWVTHLWVWWHIANFICDNTLLEPGIKFEFLGFWRNDCQAKRDASLLRLQIYIKDFEL